MPHTPHYTPEQNQLILKEVRELLQKVALSVVTTPEIGLYSNLFLVPRKDGGQRPSHQSKGLKPVCLDTTFQDGRDPYFTRDCETK